MRRFWIDTDTASDDAVAILMALRWPDVQVEGISVVSGNVPVAMGEKNARYTVQLCGKQTPVYAGADRPLMRQASYAYFFHGSDGMGEMNYPEAAQPLQPKHGVLALIEAVRRYPGEITLVTLGPLTNIALALALAPDIVQKVQAVYVMGGAANTTGNVTPAAEFNIWVDPEAARMVFAAGMPLMMVGWENCRGEANLDDAEMESMRAMRTPFADFSIDCNMTAIKANRDLWSDAGLSLPDPVTMAVVLDPSICDRRGKYFVDVETSSEMTRGATVVDETGVTQKTPNVEVCWTIHPQRWKEALYRTLR